MINCRCDSRTMHGFFYDTFQTKAIKAAGGVCKVEDMPIGARLTGVQQEGGIWIELSVQPKRIEVDGETVTFLLHQHYKRAAFAGEVNMKRGTVIRWEK